MSVYLLPQVNLSEEGRTAKEAGKDNNNHRGNAHRIFKSNTNTIVYDNRYPFYLKTKINIDLYNLV